MATLSTTCRPELLVGMSPAWDTSDTTINLPAACHVLFFGGSVVAWLLMPRTPDPEVGGSSPTRVKPCCFLEQSTFTRCVRKVIGHVRETQFLCSK